jgi:SAM-dependent methyltransferase
MMLKWAPAIRGGGRVLVAGCGVGMYAAAIRERVPGAIVDAFDIEAPRVKEARARVPRAVVAANEAIPYPAGTFGAVISHEVIEHVDDDRAALHEMVRVLKPGGRLVIFAPNRWYPFETHGIYWRGEYHFGNKPLIGYLPDTLRDRLAPHVRAYTKSNLLALTEGLPVRTAHHTRIFGAYDNIIARFGGAGRALRSALHFLEKTPLRTFGLSHLLILEKSPPF